MKKLVSLLLVTALVLTQLLVPSFATDLSNVPNLKDADVSYSAIGIVSITAEAQDVLVQGVDSIEDVYIDDDGNESICEYYWLDNANILYTITFEDGTIITVGEDELVSKTGIYVVDVTDYAETPFVVGKNTAILDCLDYEFTCEIEVVENIYTGIQISGEEELILTFLTADGKNNHTTKVVDITYVLEDAGYLNLGVVADDGRSYDLIYNFAYDEATGNTYGYSVNVSVEMAGLKSNTLDYNFWLLMRVAMEGYMYYAFAYTTMDDSFTSYSINDPQKSVDIVVAMSIMMLDYDIVDEDDNYFYHEVDLETAEYYVLAVFGFEGLDLTKSKYYDAASNMICVDEPIGGDEFYVQDYMTYADGKWTMTASVFENDENYKADKAKGVITIVVGMENGIDSITYEANEEEEPTDPTPPATDVVGDANGDGKVTAVDARSILQYVAGMKADDEVVLGNMDVNGDGRVSAVDARWVLQMVAGLL